MRHIAVCAALCAVTFSTSVFAEESEPTSPWSGELSTAVVSDYMFRGFNLYDGTAIQPYASVGYSDEELGELKASVWLSAPGEGDRQEEKFTEIDYTLSYSKAFEGFTLSGGHLWYTYPKDKHGELLPSNEFFVAVAVDTLLTPTFTVYEDYDEFDTQYYELNVSHEIAVGEAEASVTPFLSTGFASNSEKVYADDGLVQITTGVNGAIPLGILELRPQIAYTFGIDDLTVNELWIGTALAYSF